MKVKPKLSDFLLDLHGSFAQQGSAKILDISIPMSFRDGFRESLCIKISTHLFAKNRSTPVKGYAKVSKIRCPWSVGHVMGCGIDRKKIFFGNIDRNDFIPESCMKTK